MKIAGPPSKRRRWITTTANYDCSDEQLDFLKAIDAYKRRNRRPFPNWKEVLDVLLALGYRKVAAAQKGVMYGEIE